MPIPGGFAGFLGRFSGKRFTVDVQARKPEIGTQNGTIAVIFQRDGSVFRIQHTVSAIRHVENSTNFIYKSTNRAEAKQI